jgi:tetratricopeptide (TPR) repeat protein
VGESYLNELLTGGLLDVDGVRVPDADFDLRPDRRWGRSTRRAFIFLFVVLVLGIGGGGTWYWWTEKQKAEAVARLQQESQAAIPLGDFAGLESCIKKLGEALEKDKTSLLTYGYFAECTGLEALLYGTDFDRVDSALKIAKEIKDEEPGAREALIGRAAVELARLGIGGNAQASVAISTLAEVRKALDAFHAKHPKDKWATWLLGRAMLAAGERAGGRGALKEAADGDDGLVVAQIESADLLVDDGKLDEALIIYDKAGARAKDHPLLVIGRSLALAEASISTNEVIGELSVKLAKDLPSRLAAYRALASSLASTATGDYLAAADALRRAVTQSRPLNEPRFWARVVWARYTAGDFHNASIDRGKIVWFVKPGGKRAEDDPSVQLVDAALLFASGLSEKALAKADKLEGVRPQILRAYADLDLGKTKDALQETEDALKKAPDNAEAQILRAQARMIGSEGKERAEATDALEKLARRAKSKIGRHALGIAHLATGNVKDAQTQLEQAVDKVTPDEPNPLAYRTRTALASILLEAGDLSGAGKQLDEAIKLNLGYFPTRILQAKAVLRNHDPGRALGLLEPVLKEMSPISPEVKLIYAEALGSQDKVSAKDKDEAIEVLKDLKDKVPAAELSRAAAAIDPKLPKQLGLAEAAAAPPPPPTAPRPHRRR